MDDQVRVEALRSGLENLLDVYAKSLEIMAATQIVAPVGDEESLDGVLLSGQKVLNAGRELLNATA